MQTSKAVVPMVLLVTGSLSGASAAGEANIAQFGLQADSGKDATPGIRNAIEHCRANSIHKLVFGPGRYDLWPDEADEKYLFISNNDEGLKRVGFPLKELKDLEIDGEGAVIMFHGPMVPFLLQKSKGVTIKNLTFDFVRPFHSEGMVLAITPESVDVEFAAEYPYTIRNGVLVFTGPKPAPEAETTVKSGEVIYPYVNLLAFDSKRGEPAYLAKDRYGVHEGIVAKEIAPHKVRLSIDRVSASPGNILVFGTPREFPGIVISDSEGVNLENVIIHNCGGMAVIAQRSADLFLNKVQVVPAKGGGRVVSATADATHFVNIRGCIEMRECVFEGQKDDATNIHGLYSRVSRKLSADEIEVQLVHPQQFGVDFLKVGTRMELTQGPTLQPLGFSVAKEVTRLNKEYTRIKTAEPLPEQLKVGDAVADADANNADVLIKDCVIGKNRARGILLGSRGKIVVEGNTFHSPGTAILFEGDARHWFEQAGVRDVVIRNNTFDNCNYGVWGKACIAVGTGMEKAARKTTRYNKNIRIENNLFRTFDSTPLLSVYAVDGLTFRNNKLQKTDAYPPRPESGAGAFLIESSDNVHTEEPSEIKLAHSELNEVPK